MNYREHEIHRCENDGMYLLLLVLRNLDALQKLKQMPLHSKFSEDGSKTKLYKQESARRWNAADPERRRAVNKRASEKRKLNSKKNNPYKIWLTKE